MLRTTIAVFAAGLGGADAITVLPFTAALGLPDRVRAPHRAQHAAHPAGGIEPREGRRPGGRLRRHRGPDAAALHRGLDAVSGDREGGRRCGGARAGPDPEKVAATRAEREKAVARRRMRSPAPASFPTSHEAPVHVLDVAAGMPPTRRRRVMFAAAAAHPSRRAVRGPARRLRPHAGEDRRAAEGLSRQPRQPPTSRARTLSPRTSSRPAASRQ